MCVEIYTLDGREVGTRRKLADLVDGAENIVWRATCDGSPVDTTIDDTCVCAVDVAATLGRAGLAFERDDFGDYAIRAARGEADGEDPASP